MRLPRLGRRLGPESTWLFPTVRRRVLQVWRELWWCRVRQPKLLPATVRESAFAAREPAFTALDALAAAGAAVAAVLRQRTEVSDSTC